MNEHKKIGIRTFIERSKQIHGDFYGYSKTVYVNAHSKLIITCPKHGDFEQTPKSHFTGRKCKQCSIEGRRINKNKPSKLMAEVGKLSALGMTVKEICKKLNVVESTARRYMYEMNGLKYKPRNSAKDKVELIAQDRLTMTSSEVSDKYGVSVRTINNYLRSHPLKDKFKRKLIDKKPKKVKPKKREIEPKILMDTSHMNKGNVKVKKTERILPTKVHERSQQREVPLHDGKNTTVFVNINDPRSNDEIRQVFAKKDHEFFESCRDNYMSRAKRISERKITVDNLTPDHNLIIEIASKNNNSLTTKQARSRLKNINQTTKILNELVSIKLLTRVKLGFYTLNRID